MITHQQLVSAFLCAVALVTPMQMASAHRMNGAMSLVEISPTSGKIQVTHRLFAHDLEGALGAGSVDIGWFETPSGKAALRNYCLEQFSIANANNRPIILTFIGIELEGGVINVYFEGPRSRARTFLVDSNLLQEMSDNQVNQVNQVNVRASGATVSAVFQVGDAPKRLTLP